LLNEIKATVVVVSNDGDFQRRCDQTIVLTNATE
jgi:hypothetical protein